MALPRKNTTAAGTATLAYLRADADALARDCERLQRLLATADRSLPAFRAAGVQANLGTAAGLIAKACEILQAGGR
jgi:hypothetical protein